MTKIMTMKNKIPANPNKKAKLVSLRTIVTKKEMKAIDGMGISKGTTLYVVNDKAPKHPVHGYQLLLCRVDNGTGILELMPECCIRDNEL